MKFLADHDVYATTARLLTTLGHDVETAYHLGLAQSDDSYLLEVAHLQQRILLTRDRDFGNLVFVEHKQSGIIYLRLLPSTQNSVHRELQRVLELYSEVEFLQSFIVVEPGQHRLRKLPGR